MNLDLSNKYIQIEYDSSNNLMYNTWLSTTSDMTDDEYREIAKIQIQEIETNNPYKWLVEMSKLDFFLCPATQEWVDALFPKILAAGVKLIAFVISPNIFSQVSVEQLMDEKNIKNADFEIKYFKTKKEAEHWLGDSKK